MDSAIRSIQPGLSEYEIAARLELETSARGVLAVATMVACDERVFAYRHPLPTDRRIKRYAMLVLCGRKWGLVCSITRLVHFGPLLPEVQEKAQAVAQVDATFIAETRPGRKLGDIFQEALTAYEAVGYPEEWQRHHQGGSAGYEARETVATPESTEIVTTGQVYAWNPSIRGTKSEDTILIADGGFEVLTAIPGWPMLEIRVGDQTIPRPAILEIT
jgi:antitoxin VapB